MGHTGIARECFAQRGNRTRSPHFKRELSGGSMSHRSNSKAFRHIMPCSAPVCEGMHYHKTGVPWQMKSTFIIVLFLLELPRNTLFCEGFREFVKCIFLLASWQNMARWSRLLQAVSSKVGSKIKIPTTKAFHQ